MAAAAFSTPEMRVHEAEAEALASSILNVAKYYAPVAVSGKTGAWIALCGTIGLVHGPKLASYIQRRREEAAARVQAAA